MSDFSFFPEQASTMAVRVDQLYFFLLGIAVFFSTLIFVFIVAFAVKYRRRSDAEHLRGRLAGVGARGTRRPLRGAAELRLDCRADLPSRARRTTNPLRMSHGRRD